MATTIPLPPGSPMPGPLKPTCDEAVSCHWFETLGAASPSCANRENLVCPKRLRDVFYPHDGRSSFPQR